MGREPMTDRPTRLLLLGVLILLAAIFAQPYINGQLLFAPAPRPVDAHRLADLTDQIERIGVGRRSA